MDVKYSPDEITFSWVNIIQITLCSWPTDGSNGENQQHAHVWNDCQHYYKHYRLQHIDNFKWMKRRRDWGALAVRGVATSELVGLISSTRRRMDIRNRLMPTVLHRVWRYERNGWKWVRLYEAAWSHYTSRTQWIYIGFHIHSALRYKLCNDHVLF